MAASYGGFSLGTSSIVRDYCYHRVIWLEIHWWQTYIVMLLRVISVLACAFLLLLISHGMPTCMQYAGVL